MSLRPLSKLFKPFLKGEKQDADVLPVSYEGLDLSIKLLLAYVGKETTDIKISSLQTEHCNKEKRSENKNSDNKDGVHGTAILRCLGKCHGLSGSDPFEDLEIDQIVEVFNEFRIKLLAMEQEKVENDTTQSVSELNDSVLKYLAKFDAVVAANRGHLALNKLTWADFLMAGTWQHIASILQMDVSAKFPHINAMVDSILSTPNIKLAQKCSC